jgi:hypothetical protein
MKLLNRDGSLLMEVSRVEREGGRLVIVGSIMGSMPVEAVLTPTEARSGLRLLGLRMMLFVASLLLRS